MTTRSTLSPARLLDSLRRWRWRLILRWGVAALCFGLGVLIAGVAWLSRDLPSTTRLQMITQSLKTQVLDLNGDVYGSYGIENRVAIPLDEMPRDLINAVLSVEDRRFYEHWGLDILRWPKVLLTDIKIRLRSRSAPLQGASTLTQQLARDLFLTKDQRIERKLKEMILTLKIERAYSKDEILTMYLNQVYFGAGAYGVEAISRTLFDKPTSELDLVQCALVAGMPKNPWAYNPLRFPERATQRRNLALAMMADNGCVDPAALDSLQALPLEVEEHKPERRSGSYYLEYVRQYLEDRYGSDRLYRDGLTVETTIDPRAQRVAEEEMEKYVRYLEERMRYEHTYANVSARIDSGEVVPAAEQYLQSSVLVLEPETGAIRAMVGGRDFTQSEFNRATQAPRQPGSAFKLFVYLAALENGFAPSDKIMDTPVSIDIPGQSKPYKPKNHSGKFLGEITLREALNKSINIPAVKLVDRLGTVTVIDYARRLGIDSPLPPVISLALGSVEVNLLELTGAYATVAAGGVRSEPFAVRRVVDRWGQVLEEHQPERHEVIDPRSDYLITSMLETVISQGTGIRARSLGFRHPAAGKTGTTDYNFDAWFLGFTKQYACGVWVGFDEKKSMGRWMEGSHAALPIWTEVMKRLHEDLPSLPFEAPEGIVKVAVCTESGLLPTRYCPNTVQEVFIEGQEPSRLCDRHSPGESALMGAGLDFRELDLRSQEEDLPAP
ncbi:MAG: PBP1A family penicillin-binding protein [Candidatus Latescibacteria bacterium]|nr:PBP1A family penicillin-binding protein [Candidatus Latescibacterota bacterium]